MASPRPTSGDSRRSRPLVPPSAVARPVAALAVAAAIVVLSVVTGTVTSTDVTLVIMGFDPDRSQLITALIVGAMAAAGAALVLPRVLAATLIGALGVAALFAQTFLGETGNALAATGALGSFSPSGWALTLATLVVIGLVAAWAGAVLAVAVRPALIATGRDVGDALRTRAIDRARLRRPFAALLIVVLLALTVPAFGDMVNLSPDALMLGGVQRISLAGGTPDVNASPASGDLAGTSFVPTPSPSGSPNTSAPAATQTPTTGPKPWMAWMPSGSGQITSLNFDAPWVNGTLSQVDVTIYTPPGYGTDTTRKYPVLYEAPTGFALWSKGTGVAAALDSLIDTGAMPAAIVVFIDSLGAPYPDTECADSFDGQMWMETFVSKTVPDYVDAHYRTIAKASARALMGMSAGGFCAAMVTLRHPDVFLTSISFSGYFYAGIANANSGKPFGSPQGLQVHSPAKILGTIPPELRTQLFMVVVADPSQVFYGPQAGSFDNMLKADGFHYLAVDSTFTHGWPQVRNEFPRVAEAWGPAMVANGVW